MISRGRSLFSLLYFREMAYKIALLPYYMCTFAEWTNYCLDGQLLQKRWLLHHTEHFLSCMNKK